MRLLISPAKQMRPDMDAPAPQGRPVFAAQGGELLGLLRAMPTARLQALLGCNAALTERSAAEYARVGTGAPTPALFAYDGIQYRYMAPRVFTQAELAYVQEHVRILSGLYGVLRPLDGVWPYRLEMQARLVNKRGKDLYAFWGDALAQELARQTDVVWNLASEEYSRSVRRHWPKAKRWVDCVFAETGADGRLRQKGVHVKMARGQMVRFLAENDIRRIEQAREFDRLGFVYQAALSEADTLVFVRERRPMKAWTKRKGAGK